MRFLEVGAKAQGDGRKESAKEFFDRAYKLWTIFWGLRLKLISISNLKQIAKEEKLWTLREIMDKFVDCCDE